MPACLPACRTRDRFANLLSEKTLARLKEAERQQRLIWDFEALDPKWCVF
jgi:hypothetical protein